MNRQKSHHQKGGQIKKIEITYKGSSKRKHKHSPYPNKYDTPRGCYEKEKFSKCKKESVEDCHESEGLYEVPKHL